MNRWPFLTRWSVRLALALAFVIVATSSVGAASHDRTLVSARKLTQRPYRGIVLVSVGRRVVCSGFVVSPTKVVTAAHCLTRDPARGDYRFRAGLPRRIRLHRAYSLAAGGDTFPACTVSKVWAHPRFIRKGARDRLAGSRAHDYAVLTTSPGCSYPRSARMRMWANTPDSGDLRAGQAVQIGGYPSDSRFGGMNGLNLWRTRGELRDSAEPAMLNMTGFVAQGMSGGPVWRTFGKDSPCGRRQCVVGIATECAINRKGLCKLGKSIRRAVRVTPAVTTAIRRR